MKMIQLDSVYLTELKTRLEHEQWSSIGAKKLQEQEFEDLMECALYFLEKDGKICEYEKLECLAEELLK